MTLLIIAGESVNLYNLSGNKSNIYQKQIVNLSKNNISSKMEFLKVKGSTINNYAKKKGKNQACFRQTRIIIVILCIINDHGLTL